MSAARPKVLALDCSPTGAGRTSTALEAVLAAAAPGAAETKLVLLGGDDALAIEATVALMGEYDAFDFGTPIYRATFATPFKALVDATPRGMWGETEAPITGRAAALVATAASDHHFLGLAEMRNVLADFFATHLVSPGLYLPHSSFTEEKTLNEKAAARADLQGRALVELAAAIASSTALGAVTPQA